MFVRHYLLSFSMPVFLGNAWQDSRWLTSQIKSLLRQWWRAAWAANQKCTLDPAAVHAMCEQERRAAARACLAGQR